MGDAPPTGVAFPVSSVQEGTFRPSGTTMTDTSSGRGTSGFGEWKDTMSPEEYADQVAKFEEQEAASAARLAEEEAALAAVEEEEAALLAAEGAEEALMEGEALAGPAGWIAEALTGLALLGTAAALAKAMIDEASIKDEIDHVEPPKRPGLPQVPSPTRPVIHPPVTQPKDSLLFSGFYPVARRKRVISYL